MKNILLMIAVCSFAFYNANAQTISDYTTAETDNTTAQGKQIVLLTSDNVATPYSTLQLAITAADSGSVVILKQSYYNYSGTTITLKNGVNIEGNGSTINCTALSLSSGTAKISNLTVTKIINSGDMTLTNVILNQSSGLYLDMDGGSLVGYNLNAIGTTTAEPSIDINTGSVDWSGQKITGDILIDSANVNLTITDTLKANTSGGTYHLSLTGNSVLNANVGIVPRGFTYIWKVGNAAKLFLTAKDFQTSLMVSDSGYVEINNTKSSTGHCWLNVIGSGATIKTHNSYFYLDVADTTTGLHNIESTGGGNFYAYNSTFYFSGREGAYNTGGSTVAFGGTDTSIFRAYNCTFYDGGDRAAFYPQVFSFDDYSDFILENCTIKHNGAVTDAVEGVIKVKAADALNVKGKLINCSISSNSGDGIWYYGNTIRPKTTDTLVVQNVSYYGPGSYFKTGRATDLDSTIIDFELLNKVNKTFNGSEMVGKDVWFTNDVRINSTLKVGTDYGIPSRYERSGGQIVAGSIKVDGLGRHDGSNDVEQIVEHVSLSEWCVLTGLGNGDSVTVTLTFNAGEQVANKNSFLSSDLVMFYYLTNDDGYTSQYDIKVRAWGGDATEYYLGVTRNVANGVVTSPSAASIVSSANTSTEFAFEVPILYGTTEMGLSIQAFNNLNVGSITMVKH